jgi:hypothetical protein
MYRDLVPFIKLRHLALLYFIVRGLVDKIATRRSLFLKTAGVEIERGAHPVFVEQFNKTTVLCYPVVIAERQTFFFSTEK